MQVGDAYLIVYSITDRASFEKASELRIQLRRARQTEDIPIILVGNKSDLVRCREVSVSGNVLGATPWHGITCTGLHTGALPFFPKAVTRALNIAAGSCVDSLTPCSPGLPAGRPTLSIWSLWDFSLLAPKGSFPRILS